MYTINNPYLPCYCDLSCYNGSPIINHINLRYISSRRDKPVSFHEFAHFLESQLENPTFYGYEDSLLVGYYHIQLICKALIHPNCKWKYLSLRNCNIDDAGADILADALCINSTVEEIDFRYNHISDTGCKHFIEACKIHIPKMKRISFTDNDIGLIGALRLIEYSIKSGCNLTFACSDNLDNTDYEIIEEYEKGLRKALGLPQLPDLF